MRDCGLGTPATRASIIETLLARGYACREGKSLRATERGLGLIRVVDEEVKSILTHAYSEAARIVSERRGALDRLAAALLERETLEREQVELVIAGQSLPPYVPPPPPQRAESGEQEKEKAPQRTSGGILRNPPPEPAGA